MFLDLHAHSNEDAAFVFGNYWEQLEARLEIRLFARLMDIYSKHFDYESCGFGTKSQLEGGGGDPSKKGIAKSEVRKATDLVHCYTLESSYHKGTKDPNKYKKEAMKDINLDDGVPVKQFIYSLKPEDFEEVGACVADAVLELVGTHPDSKISETVYENVDNVKKDVINKINEGKKRNASMIRSKKFAMEDDDRD